MRKQAVMTSFKTKNRKKKKIDTRKTLDAFHQQKTKHFKSQEKNIQLKSEELDHLIQSCQKLKTQNSGEDTCITVSAEILEIEERIEEIKRETQRVQDHEEEREYWQDVGHVLYQYYQNKEQIAEGKIKRSKAASLHAGAQSVVEFFESNSSATLYTLFPVGKKIRKKEGLQMWRMVLLNRQKERAEVKSRAEILDTYLSKIDPNYISDTFESYSDHYECSRCQVERHMHPVEAILICPKCGETEQIVVDMEKPSYKDPPREISYFAYKRINHFNEWLAQFQAKESTDISDHVYNQILMEIKKERISNMANLTPGKLREILKRLKLNKYYEHVPHIINRINGVPAPIMTRETEEKLRTMFKEIQTPFMKYCPKYRKNFLSYSYVLHKFCQLIGLDEFLPCFQLLKSREKLHQQDIIWKQICLDLKWQFIKSI